MPESVSVFSYTRRRATGVAAGVFTEDRLRKSMQRDINYLICVLGLWLVFGLWLGFGLGLELVEGL